jgi:hypothetical protein
MDTYIKTFCPVPCIDPHFLDVVTDDRIIVDTVGESTKDINVFSKESPVVIKMRNNDPIQSPSPIGAFK